MSMRKQLMNVVGLMLLFGLAPVAIDEVYAQYPPEDIGSLSTIVPSPHLAAETVRVEISLSRRRVTLYRGDTPVEEYPIGIGRAGWETPQGTFEVKQMRENPIWIHPFNGDRIPGGTSHNPLGTRWIGFWTDGHVWVGLHGTNNPTSVGTAASHGCIRMHNADVEALFSRIEIGTPVTVVE